LAAQSVTMAVATQSQVAMYTPLFFNVPMIAPAYPALRPATASFRGAMALVALAWTAGIVALGLPRAVLADTLYRERAGAPLQERPRGDLAVGVKLFPDVSVPPSAAAARSDLAVMDSVGATAVMVVVVPGASQLALDSLRNMLDRVRRDGTLILVSVGYRGKALPELSRSDLDVPGRLRTLERAVATIRPDIVLPAEDPYGVGARIVGRLSADTWRDYLTQAAEVARRAHPQVRVGVTISGYGASDSTLYDWASRPGTPMDVVGFSLFPYGTGIQDVIDYQRAADRWMTARPPAKDVWVFGAGGYPLAQGERGQERTIWEALAWATQRTAVRGIIIYEAGDYGQVRGLRAPNGRLRPAAESLRRAITALRESVDPAVAGAAPPP
jgi:hypothetical protein